MLHVDLCLIAPIMTIYGYINMQKHSNTNKLNVHLVCGVIAMLKQKIIT